MTEQPPPPPPPLDPESTPAEPAPVEPAPERTDIRETRREADPLRGSRTSSAYTGVIVAAVLLVLLVIFVAQNTRSVRISFLWLDGRFPLAAALLIATAVGMSVVALVGSLRILQLRRRVKKDRKSR